MCNRLNVWPMMYTFDCDSTMILSKEPLRPCDFQKLMLDNTGVTMSGKFLKDVG